MRCGSEYVEVICPDMRTGQITSRRSEKPTLLPKLAPLSDYFIGLYRKVMSREEAMASYIEEVTDPHYGDNHPAVPRYEEAVLRPNPCFVPNRTMPPAPAPKKIPAAQPITAPQLPPDSPRVSRMWEFLGFLFGCSK